LAEEVIKVIIFLIFLQKKEAMMILSHTQEFSNEALPQGLPITFFIYQTKPI